MMKLTFLGTGSSYPSPRRGASSLALHLSNGSIWLFDCGEGTQIQIQKAAVSKNKIDKIFITHLHGDHLFGLPGLLCTISSHCCVDLTDNFSLPVIEIYGPLGLRKFLNTALSLSRSASLRKFKVFEIEPCESQYPKEWEEWMVDHYISPSILHPSEILGHIIKPNINEGGNISWKLFSDDLHSVECGFIYHRVPSFGFVVKENDRKGTLFVNKLKAEGIPPGPVYGKLKSGVAVVLEDGRRIEPRDYLGPSIKGHTVVICGDTDDASPMKHMVKECDVLVHEATHDDSLLEKAKEFGHSTPTGAANFAMAIGAKVLLLNHFSQRYQDFECKEKQSETTALILKQAQDCLVNMNIEVHCTKDFFVYEIDRKHRYK